MNVDEDNDKSAYYSDQCINNIACSSWSCIDGVIITFPNQHHAWCIPCCVLPAFICNSLVPINISRVVPLPFSVQVSSAYCAECTTECFVFVPRPEGLESSGVIMHGCIFPLAPRQPPSPPHLLASIHPRAPFVFHRYQTSCCTWADKLPFVNSTAPPPWK